MSALSTTIRLRAGTLRLRVDRAESGLSELCGFASRRSRKRGFVFVSKVLGKHYPVRPGRMAQTHRLLAAKLAHLPGPALLVGLAETATGLGQGVHEWWLRDTGRDDVLFVPTTRYRLRHPVALGFEESHSHAVDHLVYQPACPENLRLFREARTLVLVDDEISTGRTLANLAAAYRRLNPCLSSLHLVCLTDWLGAQRRDEVTLRAGLPTEVHSLLSGEYAFESNPAFDPGPIPDVSGRGDFKDDYLPADHQRLGSRELARPDLDGLVRASGVRPGERLLVLGSGEFAYPPYLLARRLEAAGWDVHYQSTTRSPLMVDTDITSCLSFLDNYHDGIPNYLYNVGHNGYERVLIGYETRPLPPGHALPDLWGVTPLFF
jgi:hypothetical protein